MILTAKQWAEEIKRKISKSKKSAPNDRNFIEDDFGSSCNVICNRCFKPTMQVVRPGKFQCANCG
jgi:hypothetical protein